MNQHEKTAAAVSRQIMLKFQGQVLARETEDGMIQMSGHQIELLEQLCNEAARAAIAAYLASMREQGWAMRNPDDYFGQLVIRARAAAEKAARKFPQPNYVTLKIAEEAGEVVRGCVHYAEKRMDWSEVEGEIVQLLAMLIRLVTEGDQINGVTPPAMLAAKEGQP